MTRPARYCVIGAGAAGLAAVAALRVAGLPFDCFEASDRVGGHWHEGYASLHLITARDSSGYAGHPMPATYPLFPSRAQMLAYILGFATLAAGGPTPVYLLGLTAPRGGQLPVYSAQAALVVRMLALQERRREPLAAAFAGREEPDGAIDAVPSRWQASLDRAHAVLDELEGRQGRRAARLARRLPALREAGR